MSHSQTQADFSLGTDAQDKPRVLFVDDEERILRSLRMLFRNDYQVMTTSDGHEALAMVRSAKVHVVVSDQRMPIMPGVELLRLVKEASPNTMRLLLTGYSDLEAIVGSINEGEIFRFIAKPWNTEEIKSTVAKAAEIALSLDEVATPFIETQMVSPERILVIDDDPESAVAIRSVVEERFEQPHIVEWASTLDEVFERLERQRYAVVISEIHLGEHDITPVIKTLKRFNPNIVTMVLTSFRDTSVLVDLINQGQVHRFLPKPVRRGLLVPSLKDALKRSKTLEIRPELARRHQVEAPSRPLESSISQRIMGFVKRIRVPA
jgi:DNA-binding NtrC family response regulator